MTEPDRAERAFRAALSGTEVGDAPRARSVTRRAQERRRARLAGVVGVLTVVLAISTLGYLRPWAGSDAPVTTAVPAGPPARPADPAPIGWRTEYYRDISFQVPSSWGYAYEPQCTDEDHVRDQPRGPYVSLGISPLEARTTCTTIHPDRGEHAVVTALPPGVKLKVRAEERVAGTWILRTAVGRGFLAVTSPDRSRARRIVASVRIAPENAPCPIGTPVDDVGSPRGTALPRLDWVALCQFDPSDGADAGGLTAARVVDRTQAPALFALLGTAPADSGIDCMAMPNETPAGVLLEARSAGTDKELNLNNTACSKPVTLYQQGTDWTLTSAACREIFSRPIRIPAGADRLRNICGPTVEQPPPRAPSSDSPPGNARTASPRVGTRRTQG